MNEELRIEYNADRTQIWCNVRKKFVASFHEGLEEEVRQRTVIDLVTHYRYPISHINVEVGIKIRPTEEPRRADIVIYKEPSKVIPFIVIENKKPEAGSGADQAEKYARIIGAEYAKFTDSLNTECRRLVYSSGRPPVIILITDIPPFGKEVIYQITKLVPFTNLKSILESCHNDLRRVGKDPIESFRIMSKLVVTKVFDERNTPSDKPYQVQKGVNETEVEIAARVRLLYRAAIELLTSRNDGEVLKDFNIEVDDSTISAIVTKLQSYSFVETAVDTKGAVFETFIDAAFRGPFGQYFTPRTIVDFMVSMTNPSESDLVIDPACGSGGFLIYVLSYVRKQIEGRYKGRLSNGEISRKVFEFAQDNLFGIDIAALPEFAAKVNMLMNDDGRVNIFGKNALVPLDEMPPRIAKKAGTFTLAITNPPFGVDEKNKLYLANFDTAKDSKGDLRESQDTKVLFIERCLQLVRPGGYIMIVLPNGILNNPSDEYKRYRDYIRDNAIIKAVIRLRDDAFLHTGTGSRTSLLLMQKKKKGLIQGPIFMAWVKNIGYDKQGRTESAGGKPIQNDLPIVLAKYSNWVDRNEIPMNDVPLIFVVPPEDQKDSLDPRYYNPALTMKIKELKKKMRFAPLGVLLLDLPASKNHDIDGNSDLEEETEVDTSKVIKGKAPRAYPVSGVKLIMITQIKEVNSMYILDQEKTRFITPEAHVKASVSKLQPGELLIAITGATIGKVAMVPSDIGEANICGDVCKFRVNPDNINPYFIYAYLISEIGQLQIRSRISGSTNEHLAPQAIEDLEIPIPATRIRNRIGEYYRQSLECLELVRKDVVAGRTLLLALIGRPALLEQEEDT